MWYITKYALTQGIWEVPDEATELNEGPRSYLYVEPKEGHGRIQFCPGEFFRTLEEARFKVENMVEARKRSIEKELKKLEALAATPKVISPWKE